MPVLRKERTLTGHIPKDHPLSENIGVHYYAEGYDNWTVKDLIGILSNHNPDAPVFLADKSGELHPLEDFTGGPRAAETIFFL